MLLCVKGKPKAIGKGLLKSLHTDVYRVGKVVFKIKKWNQHDVERAVAHNCHMKKLTAEFSFLPDYYGTVISAVKNGERSVLVIASFHQYADPLSFRSLREVEGALAIITEAQSKGYFMDLKPSNFGKADGRSLYLDEYGIGKTLLPPDVMENLERFGQKLLALQDWVPKGKPKEELDALLALYGNMLVRTTTTLYRRLRKLRSAYAVRA